MKENKVLFMTQAAMIAAVYVVLCVVFAPVSYGPIQARIAEAMTILPYFTPAAIPGLFIGCLIANLLGGSIMLDVGTYLLRKKNRFLAPLPPILANTLIVPFVLRYGYGEPLSIPFLMGTVGIGEVLVCGLFGMVLLLVLERYRRVIFKTA